jgi:hypothetical protein
VGNLFTGTNISLSLLCLCFARISIKSLLGGGVRQLTVAHFPWKVLSGSVEHIIHPESTGTLESVPEK